MAGVQVLSYSHSTTNMLPELAAVLLFVKGAVTS